MPRLTTRVSKPFAAIGVILTLGAATMAPAILPADVVASMHGDAESLPIDTLAPAIEIPYDALVATAGKR